MNDPMTDETILAEFRASEALLEGHFLLSSGRHSAHYLQCARVLMDAERAGRLARALVQRLPRELRSRIDMVVSPAMGGLIIGHEIGRALEKGAIFLERPDGVFHLRRGFRLAGRRRCGPAKAAGAPAPVGARFPLLWRCARA